ncbi:MAG TPA: DUF2087 domain-containing protein [Caulobacteraceae bacterium]|nr:DUF2087 domain-containing protein [Caulobacteraceae bacterium]
MSRQAIPFHAPDVSSLARSLRSQLLERETIPGHLEFLNILARAAGARNFQQMRAETAEAPVGIPASEPAAPAAEPVDLKRLKRLRDCFDAKGRLLRWPAKRGDQVLALWGLWSKLPAQTDLTEQEISDRLRLLHDFGDHALLRRELYDTRFVQRTPDGRTYRRIEKVAPPEAAALIQLI